MCTCSHVCIEYWPPSSIINISNSLIHYSSSIHKRSLALFCFSSLIKDTEGARFPCGIVSYFLLHSPVRHIRPLALFPCTHNAQQFDRTERRASEVKIKRKKSFPNILLLKTTSVFWLFSFFSTFLFCVLFFAACLRLCCILGALTYNEDMGSSPESAIFFLFFSSRIFPSVFYLLLEKWTFPLLIDAPFLHILPKKEQENTAHWRVDDVLCVFHSEVFFLLRLSVHMHFNEVVTYFVSCNTLTQVLWRPAQRTKLSSQRRVIGRRCSTAHNNTDTKPIISLNLSARFN